MHNELGFNLLARVIEDIEDMVQVEQQATSEGRVISMIVAPLSGSKRKKTVKHAEENN